jgi:hypothetical protein
LKVLFRNPALSVRPAPQSKRYHCLKSSLCSCVSVTLPPHHGDGKRFVVHAEELLTAGLAAVISYAQVGKPQSTASVIPAANRFFFII